MEGKERYFVFGLGVLLGCLVLVFTSVGKYRTRQEQRQADARNGYSVSQSILPGQDLNARNPFETGPALLKKDFAIAPDGQFLRVLIAKGKGPDDSLWRIEETLWKDPDSQREKLVRRVIMHADKLVVRLKEGFDDPARLAEALGAFDIKVLSAGRGPRLYNLQLPEHGLDAVPDAIDCMSGIALVEKAFPDYVNDFSFIRNSG